MSGGLLYMSWDRFMYVCDCGQEISVSWRYCCNCGEKLEEFCIKRKFLNFLTEEQVNFVCYCPLCMEDRNV